MPGHRRDGRALKVLIASGIWPPDVGGPASHAPELARFLFDGGHGVEVVTTASAPPAPEPYPVRWTTRRLPAGARHAHGAVLIRGRAAAADVVYATSVPTRAAAGARLAGRPLVLKLTGDPVFERAMRWGRFDGRLEDFQRARRGPRLAALDRVRAFALRNAAHVVCPSDYLRELALGWGAAPDRISVLPNPAPALPATAGREELRRGLGLNGKTLAFAGRLAAAKSLEVALEAVARNAGVSLVIAGDGDERTGLELRAHQLGLDGRVRFIGAQSRERVLELFSVADASILSSSWENFPHAVMESLGAGTPVIATCAGGIEEIVRDGHNGLLVPVGDVDALTAAVARFFGDEALRSRLGAAASASVEGHSPEVVYTRLEQILGEAVERSAAPARRARSRRSAAPASDPARPRLLIVGRTRFALPLDAGLRRKFDALRAVLDLRVLASAPRGSPRGDETFRLVRPFRPRILDGLVYHLLLPFRAARELRRFRPDAVVVQGAHEAAAVLLGRALARSRASVVLDVHGDWRSATRLYGSPARRLLSPIADRLAAFALRRADAVRTVSGYTTGLVRDAGVEPVAVFPAYMDLEPFLDRPPAPLPERPVALFVGVLELYKNVDGLAEAWRLAASRVPDAHLRIVGRGPRAGLVEDLVGRLPKQTSWQPSLTAEQVSRALDESTVLVLPSRSEGMGRVVVEALCRGRPVVASRSGGARDLIHDGVNGVLVDPGDAAALADALVRALSDRAEVTRLAAAARPSVEGWLATPEEYAERLRALVVSLPSRVEAGAASLTPRAPY